MLCRQSNCGRSAFFNVLCLSHWREEKLAAASSGAWVTWSAWIGAADAERERRDAINGIPKPRELRPLRSNWPQGLTARAR